MQEYIPRPVDTSDVEVSDEILEIAELMARNTHEIWSKGRMDEGWVYGEKQDREQKTHPSLVPYDELSEEEKDFDRRTSLGALKFLLKMGFKIIK